MTKPASIRHIYRIEPVRQDLPPHTNTLKGISRDITRLRFLREKNSHRGLREFGELKELVIFDPNQEAVAEIGRLPKLEFLYIEQTRAQDLSPLTACRSLRHLTIKGGTQVSGLDWVRDMPPLESMLIENFKKVTDISPLASLAAVKALGIEGSMWSRQRVDSLAPLTVLSQLEALFITNCKPDRDGLKPLHELRNLRCLEAAAFYSEAEFASLEQALPELSCDWFRLIREHGTIKKAISALIKK